MKLHFLHVIDSTISNCVVFPYCKCHYQAPGQGGRQDLSTYWNIIITSGSDYVLGIIYNLIGK